jgi:hypothetical protein
MANINLIGTAGLPALFAIVVIMFLWKLFKLILTGFKIGFLILLVLTAIHQFQGIQ